IAPYERAPDAVGEMTRAPRAAGAPHDAGQRQADAFGGRHSMPVVARVRYRGGNMTEVQDDHRERWVAIIEDVEAATRRLAETRRFAEGKLGESIRPGRDRVTRELTDAERRTVECVRMQASAYVWGRQDAGDDDTGESGDFGEAYAARQSRYF